MLASSSNARVLTERLSKFLKASSKADYREFYSSCIQLARLIDMAVVKNQKLSILHDMTQLLRKICEQKDNDKFQPALMVLLLSLKNAIHLGWFSAVERQELLNMSKELLGFFTGIGGLNNVDNAEATQFISTIIPRFYPSLNLQTVVVALEAKSGYETMLVDFYVLKKPSTAEELRLFVIRKDSQDTSACLVTPNHVNFLVNGKGVEKRSLASMDSGPQMPTNLTGMLKIGTNLLQIVGDFSGSYMIVIALTGTATEFQSPLSLQIYSPAGMRTAADDDLIEGPSRVSLRCPISHKRMISPVKGSSCKHHQCFDYYTFMEINSRRPSWRCPYCNSHISFPDLRLDLQMLKVLKETQDNAIDVMVSGDGSWEILPHEDTVTENMAAFHTHRGKDLNLHNSSGESSAEEGEIRCEKFTSALIDLSDDEEQQRYTNKEYIERCDLFCAVDRSMYGEFDDRKPDVSHINVTASESLTNVDVYSPGVSRATSITQDPARIQEASESSPLFVPLPFNGTDSSALLSQWLELSREDGFVTTSRADVSGSLSAVTPGNADLYAFHGVQSAPLEAAGFGAFISSEGLLERQLNREISRSPIAIQALPAQTSILNPNFRSRPRTNSQPNSPAQPSGTSHPSTPSSSQNMAHPNLSQIVSPSFVVQEGQVHSPNAGHQHVQQDTLSMLDISNTNVTQQVPSGQTQISEGFEMREHRQRYIQPWQPTRVNQPSSQPDQRVSVEHPYANSSSTERQNLHQQQVSFQQTTRQDSLNLLNTQYRQQVRFPAPHAQQIQQLQQGQVNLPSNVSNTYREENINPGFTGVAEGVPMYNQSPNGSLALVGVLRRQSSQGARAGTPQYVQSSNNPLIVPNTSASREQRWVSSSDTMSAQAPDMSAMLLTEQNQRPVARMRGSISSSGRASAMNAPLNVPLSQSLTPPMNYATVPLGQSHGPPPMNYAWLYGAPSQPTHAVTPSLGNSNQSPRFTPAVSSSWSNEPLRQWGPSRVSASIGTSLQSSHLPSTLGTDFLNCFDMENAQGAGSLFDVGDLGTL